ncbi:MAG: hypothetical protein M3Y67_05390, partial [Pseudomonadota bacterium]|nr:hypothetical protein [Pseudomonadota bacterium]
QLDFLKAHRCDEMQGYYFARPLGLGDCTQTLREDRRLPGAAPLLQLAGLPPRFRSPSRY